VVVSAGATVVLCDRMLWRCVWCVCDSVAVCSWCCVRSHMVFCVMCAWWFVVSVLLYLVLVGCVCVYVCVSYCMSESLR